MRAVDAYNGGVEAQKWALKSLEISGRRFAYLWWRAAQVILMYRVEDPEAGSGSPFHWQCSGSYIASQIWNRIRKSEVRIPDPDPSIIMQNSKKNLYFYCFVTSLW
jgi:hypothetical protein